MVSDERGQLILVGAVAIALILLGLVLIVNTALFTQVVGSEGTTASVKDGGVSGQAIGTSIAAVVAEENNRSTPMTTYGTIDGNVVATVDGELGPAFAERSVESGGSFASLDYRSRTVEGTMISQDEVGTFEDAIGNANWSVIRGTNRTDIGGFTMVIHTDQNALSNDFEVTIDNGTEDATLTVEPNGSYVDVAVDGPYDADCPGIEPTNDTVRIDVSHGRVYEDRTCHFEAFPDLGPGYSVAFDDGDQVQGTYRLATPSSTILGNLDPRFDATAADAPTRTPAVWAFEYSFTYDTGEATVESDRREVDVYD